MYSRARCGRNDFSSVCFSSRAVSTCGHHDRCEAKGFRLMMAWLARAHGQHWRRVGEVPLASATIAALARSLSQDSAHSVACPPLEVSSRGFPASSQFRPYARARASERVYSPAASACGHITARGPTLGAQAIRMGVTARTVAQWLAFRRCALPNGINRRKSSLDSKTYSSIICTMGAPFEHDAAYAPTSTSPKSKSNHPRRHEQLLSFRDN